MSPAAFRLGPPPLENEAAITLIEHLSGACKKLLTTDFSVKANANIAGGELAFLGLASPRDAACTFVVERCQQVPTPSGRVLYLARVALLDLERDYGGIIDHAFPDDLNRETQPHRLRLEHASKGGRRRPTA